MIGIYQDSFIEFLKKNLNNKVKITNKNIICKCPWCEIDNDNKNHYHCYISLTDPIFKCFHSSCLQKGRISKLIFKIANKDLTDVYVDLSSVKEFKREPEKKYYKKINLIFPKIDEDRFKLKTFYLKNRLRFSNYPISDIPNLVFNFTEFCELNKLNLDFTTLKLKKFLDDSFVGFVTQNHGMIIFRNINPKSNFLHYKMKIQETFFPDYYKINNGINNNRIIICEGIFDALSEFISNVTNLKNESSMYVACLSTNYEMVFKSIVYNENKYKLDVSILSDRNINLDFYKKLRNKNKHIINTLNVYYGNKKDFGDFPDFTEKFIE